MTFVEIDEDYFIVAESVIAVKGISKKKCALFLRGQSAMDGFVVEKGARELVEVIIDACAEDGEEIEDDDNQEE